MTVATPLTDFITLVNMMAYGTTPVDVVTAYCKYALDIPNWIASLGGQVISITLPFVNDSSCFPVSSNFTAGFTSPDMAYVAIPIAIPSFSYPTKTGPTGSIGLGADLWAFLDRCRASRGIPVMYQTPANQLIQNPTTNEILGVVATDWTGQDINVRANKAVVLACGGCENNPEIIANYGMNTPFNEFLTFHGTPYNTGDGVIMSQQVGAKLWHMNRYDVCFLGCKAGSEEIGVGLPLGGIGHGVTGATSYPIIHVNRNGSRFMNEWSASGHNLTTKEYFSYQQTCKSISGVNLSDFPNMPFYAVFDSKAMKAGPLIYPVANLGYFWVHNLYSWSKDNSAELANGWIITADTPQDLGAKITCRDFFGRVVGMDAAGLDATVTAYNAACAAGVDTAFGRPATTLLPLANPPFYAMELCEVKVNACGGPAHDKYTRTLDVNNNPIPRLYSAGEISTVWGFLYYGGCAEAVAVGRLAGEQAATMQSWTETS
jgi:hypothetical protein